MANSIFGSSLWAIVVVGGFVVLGLAIAYAMKRNKVTPEQNRRTEEATRRMYDAQNADDRTPR